jgi:hypothetical protein
MVSKTLFFSTLIMIVIWAFGFWTFHVGSIIHISLVFAGLFAIMSFSTRKNKANISDN